MTRWVASIYNGTCCAVVNGRRCARWFAQARPVLWRWDPSSGIGDSGPYVVLCRIHARKYQRTLEPFRNRTGALAPRMRIAGGWLGPYNRHNYGDAVWSHASTETWRPAAAWWRHRGPADQPRRDAL